MELTVTGFFKNLYINIDIDINTSILIIMFLGLWRELSVHENMYRETTTQA